MEQIYNLLNDDGVLIVGERMIPDIFSIKREANTIFNSYKSTRELRANFYGIIHKWDEVIFGARFYDENSFRDFILSTSFKHAEFIKDKNDNVGNRYIWAIKK